MLLDVAMGVHQMPKVEGHVLIMMVFVIGMTQSILSIETIKSPMIRFIRIFLRLKIL